MPRDIEDLIAELVHENIKLIANQKHLHILQPTLLWFVFLLLRRNSGLCYSIDSKEPMDRWNNFKMDVYSAFIIMVPVFCKLWVRVCANGTSRKMGWWSGRVPVLEVTLGFRRHPSMTVLVNFRLISNVRLPRFLASQASADEGCC